MGKVISLMTQKGGVGKTTVSNGLAACYKSEGYRVLAIDLDPQGNLSFSAGINTEICPTIYDVLKGELKTKFAIQRTSTFDVLPSNILLSALELEFTGQEREYVLKDAIAGIIQMYDYILIDSPPGLGFLTINSLTAADYVIIPMQSDIFSLQGVSLVYDTIMHIQTSCNPDLKIAGILLNNYNEETVSLFRKEIYGTTQMIADRFNIRIFKTHIRSSSVLTEAQALQLDITKYAKYSTGVDDFLALIKELEEYGI